MTTVKISKPIIVCGIITALTIVILPIIVIPVEHRSKYFWVNVLWVEVLAILIWCYLGWGTKIIIQSAEKGGRSAALLPALGISIFTYASLSLFFIISSSLMPDNVWLSSYHLARQIVLIFLFLVVSIGLYFAAKIAEQDSKSFSSTFRSPEQLPVLIQIEEVRILKMPENGDEISSFLKSLKSLREKISYSLPSIQVIGSDSQYRNFVEHVESFTVSINKCNDKVELSRNNLREEAEYLIRQVDIIASSFKR